MRAPEGLRKLARTRVRLNRLRDAKIFSGRLVRIEQSKAWMVLNEPHLVKLQDTFMVEVHGPSTKVLFGVRFEAAEDEGFLFEVGKEIRYLPASEAARIAVEGFDAVVRWSDAYGNYEYKGHLLDISKEGLGFAMLEEVSPGTTVQITVTKRHETYVLKGTVRYCRELNDGLGHCRVGVRLIHEERIPSARWMALFDRVIEAA